LGVVDKFLMQVTANNALWAAIEFVRFQRISGRRGVPVSVRIKLEAGQRRLRTPFQVFLCPPGRSAPLCDDTRERLGDADGEGGLVVTSWVEEVAGEVGAGPAPPSDENTLSELKKAS